VQNKFKTLRISPLQDSRFHTE